MCFSLSVKLKSMSILEYSTLGDVIAYAIALKIFVLKSASDVGIITMKMKLLSALENRLLSTSMGLTF